jgi:serine/threonine-protein kinase/endoribonuclease IRE1
MTFLNTTEEGAWYALSTDRFPLLASHVETAPWANCHATHNETAHPEESCNMTRTDLVGIHPIAKTLEMNIDDPPPTEDHHRFRFRNLVSLYLFIAIPLFAFWKRRAIMHGRLFRGLRPRSALDDQEALEESIESIPLTEKLPLEDEVPLAGPSHGEPSAQADPAALTGPEKKRRKRGTRGGKNGKKKAPDGQCMTEIDIAEFPEKTPLLTSSLDESTHTIDGLTITSRLLGAGSQGTFVYEGAWDGIRVAVKRMQLENFSLAEKEIRTLRESDEVLHPNIVRYYTNKRNDRFIYIALELCPATLEQIIAHPNDEGFASLAEELPPQYALAQIASGLQFLHSLHIVHRDLKPQNILVAPAKLRGTALPQSPLWRHYKPNLTRCLISDFGLGRKLEPGNSTFAAHSNGGAAGTSGWRAPEVLRGVDKGKGVMSSEDVSPASTPPPEMGLTRRITRAVDIFSMGCLFYYVLTDGEHPFGNRTYLRDGRILDNDFDLSGLDTSTNEGVEARDLISRMISPNPRDRYPFPLFFGGG